MKLISFGEVLWDIYPDGKCIGGAPFNFAAHAARLGASSYLLSAVGKDALGKETLAAVRAEGVLTDFISYSDKKTGQCLVTLDEHNIPSYNLLPSVAYDDIAMPVLPSDTDVFYFGTLALREAHNRALLEDILRKHSFGEIFCDLNIRPPFSTGEATRLAVQSATVLKISDEELPTVLSFLGLPSMPYCTAAKALAEQYKNLSLILVTRGADGAYLYDAKEKREYNTPAVKTETVSTVGAGDSFAAAFLSRYLPTRDAASALAFAARVAAFVVSKKEAVPAYTLSDF